MSELFWGTTEVPFLLLPLTCSGLCNTSCKDSLRSVIFKNQHNLRANYLSLPCQKRDCKVCQKQNCCHVNTLALALLVIPFPAGSFSPAGCATVLRMLPAGKRAPRAPQSPWEGPGGPWKLVFKTWFLPRFRCFGEELLLQGFSCSA